MVNETEVRFKKTKGNLRNDPRFKPIINAATEVFRKKGYDRTTMNDVADQMGIQKGSLYHYVNSKSELFFIVCIDSIRKLVREFREVADKDIGTMRKVFIGLENHIRLSCEEPALLIVAAESDDNLGPDQAPELLMLRREYQELWKKVLIEGADNGVLRSDLDWNIALNGMFGMLQWMFKWYTPNSPHSSQKIYETFAALLVDGFRNKAGVGSDRSRMENSPL